MTPLAASLKNPAVKSAAVALAITGAMVLQLLIQGRTWWCECGRAIPWISDVWSAHASQHLFDPYSFAHVLHGFLFWWLIAWLFPKLPFGWQLCIALAIEASWEIFENTQFVINRYREATAALGYEGDSIVNSLGDMLSAGLGFTLAKRLGWRLTLALFVAIEIVLIITIRDSLLLNIVMLLTPIESVKRWQMGQ